MLGRSGRSHPPRPSEGRRGLPAGLHWAEKGRAGPGSAPPSAPFGAPPPGRRSSPLGGAPGSRGPASPLRLRERRARGRRRPERAGRGTAGAPTAAKGGSPPALAGADRLPRAGQRGAGPVRPGLSPPRRCLRAVQHPPHTHPGNGGWAAAAEERFILLGMASGSVGDTDHSSARDSRHNFQGQTGISLRPNSAPAGEATYQLQSHWPKRGLARFWAPTTFRSVP